MVRSLLTALDSDACEAIGALAPNVEDLHLQYCGQLDDAALATWAVRLQHLRSLDLYGPFLVRREAWLGFIDARGAQLESFCIRESPRFDASCIEALASCPKLTRVALAQIGPISDVAIQPLVCPALRELDVSYPGTTAPGVPPFSLTDHGLIPLIDTHAPRLQSLNVARNGALTDAFGAALARCTHLTTLVLDETNLSGGAYAHVIRSAPHLESVSLARCNVDDETLAALAQCTSLRTLSINNANVSAGALVALAKAQLPLETLDLGFVRSVDDDVLRALSALPLRTVYVFGCNAVTPAFVPRFTLVGRERS